MSDDDSWDKEDFVPPPVVKPAAGIPEKKFEDEEEEDTQKKATIEDLQGQLERLTREFDSYRKGVEAAKERKNAKKREEEELQNMLNETDRKAKEKLLMEQAELDSARDLFGASEAASGPKSSASSSKEPPKDELARFVELVTTKLSALSKNADYSAHVERLVNSAVQPLSHERLKELGDRLSADAREKAKKAKDQKKVVTQAKAKKPLAGGGVKANSKKFSELDDYMDDQADFDEDDDDYYN